MIKITHIVWDLDIGGTQTYLNTLLKYQSRYEDVCLSLIVLKNKGALSKDVERYVTQVNYVGMKNGLNFFLGFKLLFYIFSHSPSLLHAHTCNVLTQFMLFVCGKPYVYTEHGAGVDKDRKKGRITYQYFRRRISLFLAVSKDMKYKMLAIEPRNKNKILTIYNGVDVNKVHSILPVDKNEIPKEVFKFKYRIGFIGRLSKVKRVDLFINVAKKIVEKRNDICFVIVGDGEQRIFLEKMVFDLGLTSRIFFLGFRKNSIAIMKIFDLYLLTSKFESFGLVAAEAMASNVPVVSVDICALSEIIENKKEGVLVSSKNPEVISNKVLQLLSNGQIMKKYTENAMIKVTQNFDIKVTARKLIEQYKIILCLK